MGYLFVREQGAVIHKRGERLVVEKDANVLAEVRCHEIDGVCVFGGVQVTTGALGELLARGVDLALLTRDGRLKGRLVPPAGKNVFLRLQQYDRFRDAAWCLASSRGVVAAKASMAVRIVARYRRNHPSAAAALAGRQEAVASLEQRARAAGDLAALRGIEGSAAAEYFRALAVMVPACLGFDSRRRRPPTDPVNALLSLGYVLLANRLSSLLEAAGLDPAVGFYHQLDYGRPSLALDVAEEFRVPLVDRLVVRLLNLGVLGASDFVPQGDGDERGVRLGDRGLRLFLARFGEALERHVRLPDGRAVPFARAIEAQVAGLAAAIRDGAPYQPLTVAI